MRFASARSATHRFTLLFLLAGSMAGVGVGAAATIGRPPPPTGDALPAYYQGAFSDPRWAGAVGIVVSADGRQVMSIGGIAPGPCEDKEYGHLLPGRDGATGPRFLAVTPARIRDDGSFSVTERRSGQARPFKAGYSVRVTGTFSGDTVSGRLKATVASSFDRCTANASFTARRVRG